MKGERLYTPLTLERLARRRRWWDRHLEALLDAVVLTFVAGLIWLAVTDKDEEPGADGAATQEEKRRE